MYSYCNTQETQFVKKKKKSMNNTENLISHNR